MNYKNANISFLIIIFISIIMIAGNITKGLDWGDDNASYIMQAKSILDGSLKEFICSNQFTIENSTDLPVPIAYPWGLPVLLVPLIYLFGTKMIALKSIGYLSYFFFLILIIVGFNKVHSKLWHILLVCIFAFHPVLLLYTDFIGSDIPFLLISTSAILLINKIIVNKTQLISRKIDHLIIGIIIFIAFFLRTNGILLLITLALSQLYSYFISFLSYQKQIRRFNEFLKLFRDILFIREIKTNRSLIYLLPYITFFCLVLLERFIFPKGGGILYLSLIKNLSIDSIKDQILYYVELPSDFFSGLPLKFLIFGATIPIAISGVIKRLNSDYDSFFYLILNFVMLIIYPYRAGSIRFLFPVLPFYISFVITGFESYIESKSLISSKLKKIVCILPVILIIFWFAEDSTKIIKKNVKQNNSKRPPSKTVALIKRPSKRG